jgi:SAM-dependent methyltransferase
MPIHGGLVVFSPGTSLRERVAIIAMDVLGAVVERDELLPPFSMRRIIGESRWQLRGRDFRYQGQHFVEKLVHDVGLAPHTTLLDLGSGCGRIAVPLTRILVSGRYVGLEPKLLLVRWCQRQITRRYPHFEFVHSDLYNKLYNPSGAITPETFCFPFQNARFDIVVATSVFTHLTPEATMNYLRECSRVLKNGGRLFATFFLLENGTRSPDAHLDFRHPCGGRDGAMVIDPVVPERAVAYHTDWVLSFCGGQRLRLVAPVHLGSWAGRPTAYSGQDVLIFERES